MPEDHAPARGISSRRLLLVPAGFFLLLALLPWIGEYLETGAWPRRPQEYIRELLVSGLILLLGGWILALIRRERDNARRHLGELERLTLTDPLTGLGNRRALERDLPRTLKLSERLEEPLSLLYMDVDRFKSTNDRFGHAVGDETLRVLGAVLRSSSRLGTDVAYRVGGDEFVMTVLADREGAEMLAQRIAHDFAQRSPRGSRLTFGVVEWDGALTPARLLESADARMYRSKPTEARRLRA